MAKPDSGKKLESEVQSEQENPKSNILQRPLNAASKLVEQVYMKAEEAHGRLKVCESCDKYLKNAKVCGVCKCFMPMKTRLRLAKCPIGRW